jgi:type IV secretion system protein TrbL
MSPTTANSFLDRFLAVADSGFGLIQGDVGGVLNVLIVLSIVLVGIQWILAGEAPLAPLFRKVLFVGLFAFLVNNWDHLATLINQSGAMLGLKAGGGSMSMADLHNPGRIAQTGVDMFGRTAALGAGMNIVTDFIALATIFVAAVFVMLGFFVLALQLFVALIAFKLGSLAAFVALPWGVFNGTSWVAERPLGWVAGSAVRLFVLAFVASVAISFVGSLPQSFVLADGGALQVLFFGLTMAMLAWFAPMLASEVVQGQPHLSGSDAIRTGVGAASAATGGVYLASKALIAAGRGVGGITGAFSNLHKSSGNTRGGGPSSRPASINYARMQVRPSSPPPPPPPPSGKTP